MRTAIYQLLINDTQLMASLPGGLHDAYTVPGGEISRQNTPGAYVQGELVTCCLMRFGNAARLTPYLSGTREALTFYFYDNPPRTYSHIAQARLRIYRLLHDQRLQPEGTETAGNWRVLWSDDILGQIDDKMEALLEVSRFDVLSLRSR